MDLSEIMQVGEKIDVTYKEANNDNIQKKGYSMVQDIVNKDEIIISLPMLEGVPLMLEMEQEVGIDFFRDEGCFTFRAKVLDRYRTGSISLIKVGKISPVKRFQRRNYYRLKITMPVYIRMLNEDPDQEIGLWLKAYTLNLSGGGTKISFSKKLEKGVLLQCKFIINEEEIIVKSKVVRSQMVEDDQVVRYEIGLSFVDITEYNRDLIIKFIFDEQRKLRKMGLL